MPYPKVNWQNGEAGGTPLNAENLNIMDNGIKANEDAITQNTADIEELKNKPTTALILTSASPLPNTTASNILGIDVAGKSEQSGIGKNYLENKGTSKTVNGLTFTINADKSITVKGTSTARTEYIINESAILESGTYYLNGAPSGVLNTQSVLRIGGDSSGNLQTDNFDGNDTTFTTNGNPRYVIIVVVNGTTIDATFKPMIRKEGDTTYVPYATPTPTNPIPIVDASTEIVAHTKNLFNKDDASQVLDAFIDTSANTINKSTVHKSVAIPCKPNTAYTVSREVGTRFTVAYTTSEPIVGASVYGAITNNTASAITITTGADAKYLVARITNSGDTPIETVQIEEGTTASDYVPYQSNSITLPITLRSVGTIADTLVINSDGSGKIIQRVGTMTTADFKYYVSNGGTNSNRCVLNTDNVFLDKTQIAMCDGFVFVSGGNTAIGNDDRVGIFAFRDDQKGFTFRIDKSISTADDVKNYFREKAFTIYYPLATPIITDLTAEQVSSILALRTYKGTTIIDSEMDVNSVSYSADVKGYVDDASAAMALNSIKVTRNIPSIEAGEITYTIPTPAGFPYSEHFKYKAYIVQAGAFIPFRLNSVTCTSTYISVSVTFPDGVSGAGTLELLLYWDDYKPIDVAPIAMVMSVDEGGAAE